MAAMALITDPELVIFDEPTTALDVTTQIEVLRAFKKVMRERGATAVYVSHDLAVVAQMADRIVVLRDGEMREIGTTGQILHAPPHAYTQSLLAAAGRRAGGTTPSTEGRAPAAGSPRPDRRLRPAPGGGPLVPVLDDISFTIRRGSTLGVIGDSGSGKTTLARVIAGLLPGHAATCSSTAERLPSLGERTREELRRIQIVFQKADTALNPSRTVERILGRPLRLFHGLSGAAARSRIRRLLDLVKLPANVAERLPGELSGGQKQRVNLARALAAEPALILCDEVTSALDTVVGAAVLDLLAELRRELGVSYMFISHDLSTVRAICDEIMVLYAAGREVAVASARRPAASPLLRAADRLGAGAAAGLAGRGRPGAGTGCGLRRGQGGRAALLPLRVPLPGQHPRPLQTRPRYRRAS